MSAEKNGRFSPRLVASGKAPSAILVIAVGLALLMICAERSLAVDDEPVLRIEAGMHTAPIERISTDAAGRLALTVSEDKTARLWEVATGRLIRVLRVPIDEGEEGKLYCGALSPDGRLAAVGGRTDPVSSAVYLFDTATGTQVRQFGDLGSAANDLAFSADGRYLAAVLAFGEGLHVWESTTGREARRELECGGQDSYAVDWSGSERLVTACADGLLRLYTLKSGRAGPQIKLVKKSAVRGGKEPLSARFSPDGRAIAVGFADSTAVAVVNGNDLSFRFAPDTPPGVTHGSLASVSWFDDGATLAAGESLWSSSAGRFTIWRWPQGGRGKPSATAVSKNSIVDLRPLPGGRLLFAAFDPAWGLITEDGANQTLGSSPIADYRNLGDAFGVSANAETLGFAFEEHGKSAAQLEVLQRTLLTDPKTFESLHGPRVDGLDISDWRDTGEPKLAGKPLPLEAHEISRSLAVAQDASFFILGSDLYLRCFNSKGEKLWQIDAPEPAWAVNLADQDRLALAAYSDGTIRWYGVEDGIELLAFFPHADRKRWVLWTPEGYYDCSAGGEDLIGWHFNRGNEHYADFFPASKFREQFYRPDVIQLVLATRDVIEALAQANAKTGRQKAQSAPKIDEFIDKVQPPKIELTTGGALGEVTLPSGAKDFTVQYRVRRGSGQPVERVLVYVDGRPVEDAHVEIPASDTAEALPSLRYRSTTAS